jgi:hypothetical protein
VTCLQKHSTHQPYSSGPTFLPEDDLTKQGAIIVKDSSVISNEIQIQSTQHEKVVSCELDCSDESLDETQKETAISQSVKSNETEIKERDQTESTVLKEKAKKLKKKKFVSTRKPFKCKFCGFEFTKLSAAKTHVEINHLVKIQ